MLRLRLSRSKDESTPRGAAADPSEGNLPRAESSGVCTPQRRTSAGSIFNRVMPSSRRGKGSSGGFAWTKRGPSGASVAGAALQAPSSRQVNGFDVHAELPSLQVDPEDVAPYSMPEDLLEYVPSPDAVMTRFRNGEVQRNIHCSVELTPDEQQKLATMRELAKAQGLSFDPSLASAALRYLCRAKHDPRRALREMGATQEWRSAYFAGGPVSANSVREDLSQGIVYFCGRDKLMRPILILRPARIPDSWYQDKRSAADRLVRLLVFCIEYMLRYMVFPGKVEGGVALMDLRGLTLSQLPLGPLRSILSLMANHYVNRIFRFYILNLPPALSASAQLGLRLLSERQRQKLQIVKNVAELAADFALHQLEKDLGGSEPVATTFLPFPLRPGPFEAGHAQGPEPSAEPDLHLAFSPAFFMGRAWDPACSAEENTCWELSDAAKDFPRLRGRLQAAGALDGDASECSEAAGDALRVDENVEEGPGYNLPPHPADLAHKANDRANLPCTLDAQSTAAGSSDDSGSKRPSVIDQDVVKLEPRAVRGTQAVLDGTEVRPRHAFWCAAVACTSCTATSA